MPLFPAPWSYLELAVSQRHTASFRAANLTRMSLSLQLLVTSPFLRPFVPPSNPWVNVLFQEVPSYSCLYKQSFCKTHSLNNPILSVLWVYLIGNFLYTNYCIHLVEEKAEVYVEKVANQELEWGLQFSALRTQKNVQLVWDKPLVGYPVTNRSINFGWWQVVKYEFH